jgi:hypothetical protein
MGVMTISLKKEDEDALRKLAKLRYGDRKGAISKTVGDAARAELTKLEVEDRRKRAMELIDSAGNRGGRLYKTRDELYDA